MLGHAQELLEEMQSGQEGKKVTLGSELDNEEQFSEEEMEN